MGAFNCLHPKKITTSRGQIKYVRCGHCVVCENRKSFDYTTQCQLESASHRYTLFVTLTYDNLHLPLVRPVSRSGYTYYNPVSPALHEHFVGMDRPIYAVSSDYVFDPANLGLYYSKFALPDHLYGLIPVLDKVDLQLFLKRLRYYLSKYTNEKIRYYACGEYGPVHFRPHYHLLLWYDDAETAKVMGQAILSSWKFGRVDYQIAKGSAASYVAQYSNSISARSRLHGIKYLRPFVLHSTCLFGSFYQEEQEKIPELSFDGVNNKVFVLDGRSKQIPTLLSFETRYFGRCINYDQKSHRDRLLCYEFAATAVREFGLRKVSDLAALIWRSSDSYCHRLMASFTFNHKFNENTIKSLLYLSRRFLRFCDEYDMTSDEYLCIIENYWKAKDYYCLKTQLSEQEQLSASFGKDWLPYLLCYYDERPPVASLSWWRPQYFSGPVRDYLLSIGVEPQFYNDELFPLSENPVYKEFVDKHNKLSLDRIKHKELNDRNKIFF